MNDFNSLTKSSIEMHHIILEFEKFKFYLMENAKDSFKFNNIFENDKPTFFAVEIFHFWLKAKDFNNIEKADFLAYAKELSIPVINHDIQDLSWFGKELFDIWSESIKQKMLK